MQTLFFNDMFELCEVISNKYKRLTDEFADISIIAKYDEAKEIIKELLCLGHDVANIDIQDEFDYCDEYIISLNFDGVWCEKFKRDNGYFNADADVTYISNECNPACITYVKSKKVYAFEIDIDDSDDESIEFENDGEYHITVECKLDFLDSSMKRIENIEKSLIRMNDAPEKMDSLCSRKW